MLSVIDTLFNPGAEGTDFLAPIAFSPDLALHARSGFVLETVEIHQNIVLGEPLEVAIYWDMDAAIAAVPLSSSRLGFQYLTMNNSESPVRISLETPLLLVNNQCVLNVRSLGISGKVRLFGTYKVVSETDMALQSFGIFIEPDLFK